MPHVLLIVWPHLLVIAALAVVLWLLVKASGARLHLARLRDLHRGERGGVQSLSFVLTLPLFIMILMGIVQASQIMIAQVVMEYAAVAAVRSAIVWIPAQLEPSLEEENGIGDLVLVADEGFAGEGQTWYVNADESSPKYRRIKLAAAMACMPIAPSRTIEFDQSHPDNAAYQAIRAAYFSLAPTSAAENLRTEARLEHKLAYSLTNTLVDISIFHKGNEPPLAFYGLPDRVEEFAPNEVGWQDQITVQVVHRLALLPGPGRMLSKVVSRPDGTRDRVAEGIEHADGEYFWPLFAYASLGNEGEKPVYRYDHQLFGQPY
ncbi:MAG: TadE family protein [Pirellulales bacterium]